MDSSITDDIVQIIKRYNAVQKIILFGSRARGDASERSDIDIAAYCPDIPKSDWLSLCDAVENSNALLKIDLISYTESPESLRKNIDKEGVLLYEQ